MILQFSTLKDNEHIKPARITQNEASSSETLNLVLQDELSVQVSDAEVIVDKSHDSSYSRYKQPVIILSRYFTQDLSITFF